MEILKDLSVILSLHLQAIERKNLIFKPSIISLSSNHLEQKSKTQRDSML